jgi:tetratricopeptide (TPR) repeat protein
VANEIVQIDPDNEIAIVELVEAYRARGDTAKAIEYSMKLFRLNQANTQTGLSIVEFLGAVGAPDSALVIVGTMKTNNPGDAALLEREWKLYQAKRDWKRAIAAGEEMVKFDTAKADTVYFARQIGAALQDSQPQLALQYLGRATAKFPRDLRLLQGYVTELRKQGQLQQALEVAKKVIAVDPKAPQGYSTIVFLYTQLNQGDSAVAFAKHALATADSATRDEIGKGLLTLIAPALQSAQKLQADTTTSADVLRDSWGNVYRMSAAVDSIVPQMHTAFYMSVAAFYLANNALGRVQGLSRARNNAGACAELQTAANMVLVVDLNMARGGRVDPPTAANILNGMSQIRPYIQSTRQQLNCR